MAKKKDQPVKATRPKFRVGYRVRFVWGFRQVEPEFPDLVCPLGVGNEWVYQVKSV